MINSTRDLNFDISMCDHWSRWPRHLKTPSHPFGQYFKLCQGNKLRKKLPWTKSATQGLVKSETDLLSICKSRLLFFHRSILKFSLHLACPRLPKNLTQEEKLIRRRPAKSFPTTNEMLNMILKSESVGNWEFGSEWKVIETNSLLMNLSQSLMNH